MSNTNKHPFIAGLLAGIAITCCAGVMLALGNNGNNEEREQDRSRQATYFVTGDINNATLWRQNADGTLTCVSRNTCRRVERPGTQ